MGKELILPPHIENIGFGNYQSRLTGRVIGGDKIKKMCSDYWKNNPPETINDIPVEPEIEDKLQESPAINSEQIVDDYLEKLSIDPNNNEVSPAVFFLEETPIKRRAKRVRFVKPIENVENLNVDLDLVIGIELAKQNVYWPHIKNSVEKDLTGEDISNEKYLAIVCYGLHMHYPFVNKIQFISDFVCRSEEVVKNHIAFGYHHSSWFLDDNVDIGGIDYELIGEIQIYFKKYYELKDGGEF